MTDDELDKVLAGLPYPSPAPGFADRVMAQVAVRRPLVAARPSLAAAASLAVVLFGSMAASIAWTLGHQEVLAAVGRWLAAEAGEWTVKGVREVIGAAAASPGAAFLRTLAARPFYVAAASALGSLLYIGGVFALRRLMAVSTPRMAHVQG